MNEHAPGAPLTRTWTAVQVRFLAFQAVVLTVAWLFLLLARHEYVDLLFNTPLGRKLLVASAVLLGITLIAAVGGGLALDAVFREDTTRPKVLALWLSWGLGVGQFLFGFAPAIFTVLIGPAAIQIMDSMARG